MWIYIPETYKEMLAEWQNYYSYDTEDDENGKLVAYSLHTDSKDYKNLMEFLNKNNIYNYIFRRVYNFSKKELQNSEILWFWTDDDAKESYITDSKDDVCVFCENKILAIERGKLYIDYKKIKKYDIMSTYNGDIETIVSERVRQLFEKENISGAKFESIYQIGKENEKIEGFYHLILQEGIGEVKEPSIIEKGQLCAKCGEYDKFICKTVLNFERKMWKGLDICYTKNWFGGPPKFKCLIVSNKLYRVLVENNIKNVYFQPAYFID